MIKMDTQNKQRTLRVYRALRVTGKVATLMRSQGLKAVGAMNPIVLAVDAALSVLDVGRAYFRLAAEREKTQQLELELKTIQNALAADMAREADTMTRYRRELSRNAEADQEIMKTFRLLETAAKILRDKVTTLAENGENDHQLTRKYELFINRYLKAVEQLSLTRETEEED